MCDLGDKLSVRACVRVCVHVCVDVCACVCVLWAKYTFALIQIRSNMPSTLKPNTKR